MSDSTSRKIKWLHDIMVALDDFNKIDADEEMMALYREMREIISKWVALRD